MSEGNGARRPDERPSSLSYLLGILYDRIPLVGPLRIQTRRQDSIIAELRAQAKLRDNELARITTEYQRQQMAYAEATAERARLRNECCDLQGRLDRSADFIESVGDAAAGYAGQARALEREVEGYRRETATLREGTTRLTRALITAQYDPLTGFLRKQEGFTGLQLLLDDPSLIGLEPETGEYTTDAVFGEDRRGGFNREYLTIIFVDIDNFGRVNKVNGAQVGDQVLKRVADRMRAFFREYDIMAQQRTIRGAPVTRYGGEEFFIAAAGMNWDVAQRRLGDLGRAISDYVAVPAIGNDPAYTVTLSAGAIVVPRGQGILAEDAITDADALMRMAKRGGEKGGKHRIILQSAEPDSSPQEVIFPESRILTPEQYTIIEEAYARESKKRTGRVEKS